MSSSKKKSSIFDRLTDSSQYTGSHQHRFDANGKGRGLAGRDRIAKGGGTVHTAYTGGKITDISQITRTNLRVEEQPKKHAATKAAPKARCCQVGCKNTCSPTSKAGACSYH